MQKYLLNLIPRIKKYGKQLNKVEEFVDKSWIFYNESGDVVVYRFKRNNVLRKTVNGNIQDLFWELEGLDAISVIDPITKKGEMYRHGFVLDGLLIVQKEGIQSAPVIFFNEAVIPDGNVSSYLFDIFVRKENLQKGSDDRGYLYKRNYDNSSVYEVGSTVYDSELKIVENDVLRLADRIIYIQNGKIASITYFRQFESDKGLVKINSDSYGLIQGSFFVGDKIEIGNDLRYTGQVKLKSGTKLSIENGMIKNVSQVATPFVLIIILIVAILCGCVFWFNSSKSLDPAPPPAVEKDSTEVPLQDTIAYADTIVTLEINTLSENIIKATVESYLDMINKRSWDRVSELFSGSVSYFNEQKNTDQIKVLLENYWSKMSSECGATSNKDVEMDMSIIGGNYVCKTEVVELAEKGFYKIPYVYVSDLVFELNSNYKILSLRSEIKLAKPYFHKLFSLQENISYKDYRMRNSSLDWNTIFNKMEIFAANTPSVYNEYVSCILDMYGNECSVQDGSINYHLSDYLNKILSGQVVVKRVKEVYGSEKNKLIELF